MRRNVCRLTQDAIQDIFAFTQIDVREDALQKLADLDSAYRHHIENCGECDQALEAHLNQSYEHNGGMTA